METDGNGRNDDEREDAQQAAWDVAHDVCVVCGTFACFNDGCMCDRRRGEHVDGHALHLGGCLEAYREGERELAALEAAVRT